MRAYAETVGAHPEADMLSRALEGRYRFVVTPGGGLSVVSAHDLLVLPGHVEAQEPDHTQATVLTVTADYPRWKGLITGTADFVMSFLTRRIKVEGSITSLAGRISDVAPLVDSLNKVPTTFDH